MLPKAIEIDPKAIEMLPKTIEMLPKAIEIDPKAILMLPQTKVISSKTTERYFNTFGSMLTFIEKLHNQSEQEEKRSITAPSPKPGFWCPPDRKVYI